MKKYELLENDTFELLGRTLYRIRALRNFGDVRKGDFGGYIAKESNLAHEDNCWVYDKARVFDNARVFNDARVQDNALIWGNALVFNNALVCDDAHVREDAQIFGDARVCDDAVVFGNARIHGDANINGNAFVDGNAVLDGHASVSKKLDFVVFSNVGSQSGTLTVYKGKDRNLLATRGCFVGTVEEFLAKSKREHNEKIHREYKLLIEVAKSRILIEPITEPLLDQELTHGEKLVGITFNVGNNSAVHVCKKRFADAIDQLEAERESADANGTLNANKQHLIEEAQMRILDAQMWAVKAVTYGL